MVKFYSKTKSIVLELNTDQNDIKYDKIPPYITISSGINLKIRLLHILKIVEIGGKPATCHHKINDFQLFSLPLTIILIEIIRKSYYIYSVTVGACISL